jgi:hypothetical protein
MSWKEAIPGCFGDLDRIFLSHPIDKKRAENLLEELFENAVTKNELQDATRKWLESEKCHIEQINEQVIKVGKWFDEAIKRKRTKKTGSGLRRTLRPHRK